jgi:hypothetical protein
VYPISWTAKPSGGRAKRDKLLTLGAQVILQNWGLSDLGIMVAQHLHDGVLHTLNNSRHMEGG